MVSRITTTLAVLTLAALTSGEIRADTLYVTDLGNSSGSGGVLQFMTTGSPLLPTLPGTTLASGFQAEGVTCLLVNGVTELFVADITDNVVKVYNANTGVLLGQIITAGSPNGGISVSSSGILYVPLGNSQIVGYNVGVPITDPAFGTVKYSSATLGPGMTDHDAIVNPTNGMVYSQVFNGVTTSIVEYSPDLATVQTFISSTVASGVGMVATGFAFDGPDFWGADFETNSVFEFNSSGQLLRTLTSCTLLHETFDLALGPDGNMYATNFLGNSITEIDVVDGTYALSTFIPDAGTKPKYLEFKSECCTAVPEPSSFWMLFTMLFTSVGIVGFMVRFRHRNKTAA